MPAVHSSANSSSVDPDPSGVRLAGSGDESPDRYVDDEDNEESEGSFFGSSEDAATNRVFRIYARKSVDDGHGADIKAAHQKRYYSDRRPVRERISFGSAGK